MTAPATVIDLPVTAVRSRRIAWEKAWWVPLLVILAAQAWLSVKLIAVNYGSGDEGRYIYAGHQLIYELWHGGGSPYYETYFSGAPVLYPVLAAMADHLGGLVQVGLLSLAFMLSATALLFAVTRRLFGYWPGLLAAGLFAGIVLTQNLGALATYDSMSLMLMAAAVYVAIRTGDTEPHASRWLLALPVALLAANATKYMTLVFDPVIIGLAAMQVREFSRIWRRCVALSAATVALLALTLFLAGSAYLNGLLFSTLARNGTAAVFATAASTDGVILRTSWGWIGLSVAAAGLALVIALLVRRDRRQAGLIAVLLLASTIVTLEALHLHTIESMRKHDDFAAWYACAAAGSLALIRTRHRWVQLLAGTTALVAVVSAGMYSRSTGSASFEVMRSPTLADTAYILKPYLELPHGRFLLGGFTDDEILYDIHLNVPWFDHVDDIYIKYPIPGRGGDAHGQARGPACFELKPHCMYLEGIAGYRAAIHAHWLAMISMVGNHGIKQDWQIEQAVRSTPGYILLTEIGKAPTWILASAYQGGHHAR